MVHPPDLGDIVREVALANGAAAVAVTSTEPFLEARHALHDRKAAGLHAGMHFTYGRPDRSTDPRRILDGARSLVVVLRSYGGAGVAVAQAEREATPEAPMARVAAYVARDEYGELARTLELVADTLRAQGARAEVVMDDNRLVDRAAAARAGLGWLGRNTMLLHPEVGSWTVIGSVVTDAELVPDDTVVEDGCGPCRRCQTACPTGALDEPGVLDANRCLAWLVQAAGVFPRQFRVALGNRLYGCDDCQEVCPVNDDPGVGAASSNPPASPRAPLVDVLALLGAPDAELLDDYGHWYVPRRRPEYLRRNALVVLGNSGVSSPAVRDTLQECLRSSHPVVRAHAVWAADRLGQHDLVEAAMRRSDFSDTADDPEGWVEAELAQRELAAHLPRGDHLP